MAKNWKLITIKQPLYVATFLLILSLFPRVGLAQQTIKLTGNISEANSQEPIPNAHVYSLGSLLGVTSNSDGNFLMSVPKGESTIVVSFIGYKTDTIQLLLSQDTVINIKLVKGTTALDEITLVAEQDLFRQEANTVVISQKMVETMPTLSGEADIVKALQFLPGISNGQEGMSALYVRGGGPDQNLILLDGVPVYNAAHLFGYISVFNGNAISGAKIIKGGFPAKYGGRLSSVLEVSLREGNKNEWEKDLTISPFTTNLMIEGPIKKGRSSVFLTGRASYFNWFLGALSSVSNNSYKNNYGFEDWNFRYSTLFKNGDKLSASFYAGDDRLLSAFKRELHGEERWDEDQLRFGNITGSLKYSHNKNHTLANHQLYFTKYRNDINTTSHDLDSIGYSLTRRELKSGIQEIGIKSDFLRLLGKNHRLNWGVHASNIQFNPGSKEIKFENAFGDTTKAEKTSYNTFDTRLYLEDEYKLNPRFTFRAGIHFSVFIVNQKSYFKAQPRLGFKWDVTESLNLYASYTEMQQALHLLSNYGAGLPTDLWVSATDKVKPGEAKQLAVGIDYALKGFNISLEAYHKTMSNLITYEDGANFLELGRWDTLVEQEGAGKAYGVELLVSKNFGKWNGWIGYTYSHTYRKFENINRGEWFPYRYDRRHDISVVASYKPKPNIELSAAWVYGTGTAFTIETDVFPYLSPYFQNMLGYSTPSSIVRNPGDRNSFRAEPSHRLDIGAHFTKEKKNGSRIWAVSLYNAYCNNNPYYYYTEKSGDELKLYKVALMPIIPSLSWRRKF